MLSFFIVDLYRNNRRFVYGLGTPVTVFIVVSSG